MDAPYNSIRPGQRSKRAKTNMKNIALTVREKSDIVSVVKPVIFDGVRTGRGYDEEERRHWKRTNFE